MESNLRRILLLLFVSFLNTNGCIKSFSVEERRNFVEYIPGDLNMIISIPHGGFDQPSDIPDRTAGCLSAEKCVYVHNKTCGVWECRIVTGSDTDTIDLGMVLSDILLSILGAKPHVIISHLKRTKLDPNREKDEAAQGESKAIKAYEEFHAKIEEAKAKVKVGILFDLHGQKHMKNTTELGYRVKTRELNAGNFTKEDTSIRSMASKANVGIHQLISGSESLGAFLEQEGFLAVPSPRKPTPGSDKYYRGGFITNIHGSISGSSEIDAIQLETPVEVRSLAGKKMRHHFGQALAKALAKFYLKYYHN